MLSNIMKRESQTTELSGGNGNGVGAGKKKKKRYKNENLLKGAKWSCRAEAQL